MLVARDDAGDRTRALELMGYADATYRELGMASSAQDASQGTQAREGAPAPGR
jgi:hypothetical protein